MKKITLSILIIFIFIIKGNSQTHYADKQILQCSELRYADEIWSVNTADLNNDGFYDIISASGADNKIAWYANNGDGTFSDQKIISTQVTGTFCCYYADIDNDGDIDVIGTAHDDGKIVWFENDGYGNFSSEKIITEYADGIFDVYAIDIDGDNDIDLVSASENDDKIAWYENIGGSFSSQKIISSSADLARSVTVKDINGDGYLDVISASYNDNKIAWYKNDGTNHFNEITISTSVLNAVNVYSEDLDGDSDFDIVACAGDKVIWLQNDGNGNFSSEILIADNLSNPNSAIASDVDNDGDFDIVFSDSNNGKILWYENDGNANFSLKEEIDTNIGTPVGLSIADLDNDDDKEIVAAVFDEDQIYIYNNMTLEILEEPQNLDECDNNTVIFTIQAKDAGTFQWEYSSDGGDVYNTITDNEIYSGATNDTLQVYTSSEVDDYLYRCEIITEGGNRFSNSAVLNVDYEAPQVIRDSYNLYLDSTGSATLYVSDFGILNEEIIQDSTLEQSAFDCSNKGELTQYLEITDGCLHSSSIEVHTYVIDTIKPSVTARDTTLYLDNEGAASIKNRDVIVSAWDNCWGEGTDTTLSKYSFGPSDLGNNEISISINDGSFNTTQTTCTVSIIDTIAPVIGKTSATLFLGTDGQATLYASVFNVTDNCSVTDTTLSRTLFSDSDLGDNTITLTAKDLSGNITTMNVMVTVKDDIAPTLEVQNLSLFLDENGTTLLTPEMIVSSATDNCSVADTTVSQTSFNCSAIGDNSVTVTLTDGSGNETNQACIVTILDNLTPVISCPDDTTVEADENGNYTISGTNFDAVASDNCSFVLSNNFNDAATLDGAILTTGEYTITWTATDESKNSVSEQFKVYVIQASTGIAQQKTEGIRVYPNPFNDILTVETELKTGKITIYDITGKILNITKITSPTQVLDLSNMKKGIYILKTESDTKHDEFIKIIKQ
ncbi:MAG: T9SS type A sorting domain-containing protein [Chlorobi bacterium]|nr:T9SS type A sorting domain-containing protein [Chlorobiota bacterium]